MSAGEENGPALIRQIQEHHRIVGRHDELALALAVLQTGRHVLFEGAVGVGKTTVALAVCRHLGRVTWRVDGDDRYSESKLTGWFDPPLVMKKGYCDETFFPGPLVHAMREGAVLFINELNRMPEGVQNVLLPALDEGLLSLPRLGEIHAAPGFQVIATQNPSEYIATAHLSEALRDRFEHIALDHQSAPEEALIVQAESWSEDELLIWRAVAVTRATRVHHRFRKGASVRAAIAMVTMAEQLRAEGVESGQALRRAAVAALSTRTEVSDELDADFAAALDEIMAALADLEIGELREVAEAPEELLPRPRADRRPERDLPARGRATPVAIEQVMQSSQPEPQMELEAIEYFSERLRLPAEQIDGWQIAKRLTKPGCELAMAGMREYAERLAVRSVLERAAALVGPLRGATHTLVEPMREPHQGELELDETLENLLGKEFPERQDWLVEHREERRTQIVLMLDTSLSMAGANMALAAVAAAVLALKMRPEDLSVVVFENTAEALSHLEDADPPEHVVKEMLRQPCRGYTDIEGGLRLGLRELQRGRNPRKYGLLITDGVYTRGGDPTDVAARFPHLFVLLTEDYKMNELLCRQMAAVGKGQLFRVRSLRELPRRMVDVADRLLR